MTNTKKLMTLYREYAALVDEDNRNAFLYILFANSTPAIKRRLYTDMHIGRTAQGSPEAGRALAALVAELAMQADKAAIEDAKRWTLIIPETPVNVQSLFGGSESSVLVDFTIALLEAQIGLASDEIKRQHYRWQRLDEEWTRDGRSMRWLKDALDTADAAGDDGGNDGDE